MPTEFEQRTHLVGRTAIAGDVRAPAVRPRVPAGLSSASAGSEGERKPTRSGATRALNLRLQVALHERYRALLRGAEDADIRTSFTEIVHALLLDGPGDVDQLRDVLRRYRRAIDDL